MGKQGGGWQREVWAFVSFVTTEYNGPAWADTLSVTQTSTRTRHDVGRGTSLIERYDSHPAGLRVGITMYIANVLATAQKEDSWRCGLKLANSG